MADPKGPVYHQNLGAAPRTLLFLRPKGPSTYKWEAWIREIFEIPPLGYTALPGARSRGNKRMMLTHHPFMKEGSRNKYRRRHASLSDMWCLLSRAN